MQNITKDMFFHRFCFLIFMGVLSHLSSIAFAQSNQAQSNQAQSNQAQSNQCRAPVSSKHFHICYFSLNNEMELTEMQKFIRKANQHTNYPISVREYLTEGDSPEESFQKMVESGVRCDGLVISGHHTGAFGGKRAVGSLSIDFLEKLSCDEKYHKWFSQVNALWLQGCRTLGVGEIVIDEEEESSADYHTRRVGAILEADHLEQSIADLNIEFSATLDQDNPLDSRYLRVFPGATVFGWTKTAPGERAGSAYSIPFHIAHISKLTNDPPTFPLNNPIKGAWTKESSVQYFSSITGVLNGSESGAECQQRAVQAWKAHGNVQNQTKEYGFYNPDLNAHLPLKTHDFILQEVRLLDCLLKNSEEEVFLNTLDEILKNPAFIRYTYNSLLERLKNLNKENPQFYAQTVQSLRTNPVLNDFISKKLSDPNLGILRKIDYLAFYEQIYGPSEKIRSALLDKVQEHWTAVPSTTRDEIDYKVTVFYSLAKHGYLRDPIGLQLFKQAFLSPKVVFRRYAVQLVEWIGGELALSFLEEGVHDKDPVVRREVMLTMGRTRGWKRGGYLLNQSAMWTTRESETEERENAWFEEREKSKETILFILEKGAEDDDPIVRRDAMWAVGRIGESQKQWSKRHPPWASGVGRIGQSPLNEANPITKAKWVTGHLWEELLSLLEKGSQDPYWVVRVGAMESAGKIGEKALPLVEKGIKDKDYAVRQYAIMAGGDIGIKALPLLQQVALNDQEHPALQDLTSLTIAKINQRTSVENAMENLISTARTEIR